jgi:hypothetical protein
MSNDKKHKKFCIPCFTTDGLGQIVLELPAAYTHDEFEEIIGNMSAEEKLEFLRSAE